MNGIPVLMYHALEDETHPAGAKDAGEQLYVLHVKQFREQMEYLHREGYRTFLLEELHLLDVWPEKSVVLTFDDGHESNYTLALPVLQEYGFKAVFFITTGWVGTPHYMTEEQIMRLHQAGMGIGSHGVTHNFLVDLSNQQILQELMESREQLSDIIKQQVISFSAPGGRIDERVASIAREYLYTFISTSRPSYFEQSGSFLDIPRYALRHNESIVFFRNLVCREPSILRRIVFKNHALSALKSICGNHIYCCIRNIFLR